jgi:hypothetical protein
MIKILEVIGYVAIPDGAKVLYRYLLSYPHLNLNISQTFRKSKNKYKSFFYRFYLCFFFR